MKPLMEEWLKRKPNVVTNILRANTFENIEPNEKEGKIERNLVKQAHPMFQNFHFFFFFLLTKIFRFNQFSLNKTDLHK